MGSGVTLILGLRGTVPEGRIEIPKRDPQCKERGTVVAAVVVFEDLEDRASERRARQQSLEGAHGEARQVELLLWVDTRQLRRLPAYEGAPHRLARLCNALYQGLCHFRDQAAYADIVQKENGPGAAGEDIDCGLAVLGPGMDAKVGFGDGHDAGNALRSEPVEGIAKNHGSGRPGCVKKCFTNVLQVIQLLWMGVTQFNKQVST